MSIQARIRPPRPCPSCSRPGASQVGSFRRRFERPSCSVGRRCLSCSDYSRPVTSPLPASPPGLALIIAAAILRGHGLQAERPPGAVPTALTVQSGAGVRAVHPIEPMLVDSQLRAVMEDRRPWAKLEWVWQELKLLARPGVSSVGSLWSSTRCWSPLRGRSCSKRGPCRSEG